MAPEDAGNLDSRCGECLLFGAIQGLADGLILVDGGGKVFHLNRRAGELLGLQPGSLTLGTSLHSILSDQPLNAFWRSVGDDPAPVTADLHHPEGATLRATITQCRSAAGALRGHALLLRDITNEKKIRVELSASVARRLVEMAGGPEPAGEMAHLTRREMQILRLLAAGMTNSSIASELCVRSHTVATHLKHLYAKIKVRTRSQAAVYAVAHGMHPAGQ